MLEGKNGARGRAKIGSIRPGNFADLVVVSADPLSDISNTKKIERVMKNGRWIELGYHPEYVTLLKPAGSLAASTFAPVISSIQPSSVKEGSPPIRVVLEGSGFMMTSLVRIDGISVKTTFRDPRHLEFDLPAGAIARATPNPYSAPGPVQNVGIIGDRAVAVHVFNPPPEGGARTRFTNWCCQGKRQRLRCPVLSEFGARYERPKTFGERTMALTAAQRIQIPTVPIQNGG